MPSISDGAHLKARRATELRQWRIERTKGFQDSNSESELQVWVVRGVARLSDKSLLQGGSVFLKRKTINTGGGGTCRMGGDLIGEEVLEHQHGKARVRVARKWLGPAGTQIIVEWSVSISLTSTALPAFTSGDNSAIVATDTIKNTVYVMAKKCSERVTIEEFGTIIGKHFVSTYPEVSAAKVSLIEKPWERVTIDGKPHEHGFKLGSEKRTAEVYTTKDGSSKVKSGIQELILLKTTQSGFEGFIHDRYTILADTSERMMASSVRAIWSYSRKPSNYEDAFIAVKSALISKFYGPTRGGVYSPSVQNTLYTMGKESLLKVPEVESIYLNMPNIHFLPVNLPSIGVKFKDDVYLPTDEPHGSIEASLTRKGLLPVAKL